MSEPRPDFRTVFEQNVRYVWRLLRRLGVPEADTEDVCQEVFVVVHRKLATFDGSSKVTTWLYGICIRAASDYRRRAHVRRESVTADMPEGSVAADQDRVVAGRQAIEHLDALLSRLDDDKRAVFVLYEIEGMPMAEAAKALGCPLQTAYTRLHAARDDLKVGLERADRSAT